MHSWTSRVGLNERRAQVTTRSFVTIQVHNLLVSANSPMAFSRPAAGFSGFRTLWGSATTCYCPCSPVDSNLLQYSRVQHTNTLRHLLFNSTSALTLTCLGVCCIRIQETRYDALNLGTSSMAARHPSECGCLLTGPVLGAASDSLTD